MGKEYIKRLFDDVLDFSLKSKGAVVVVGPKWCGKSTTASRYAKTLIDLMPLDSRSDYINLAKVAPSEFLNLGDKPILIDEWQHVSFIWDQIKYEVDKEEQTAVLTQGRAKLFATFQYPKVSDIEEFDSFIGTYTDRFSKFPRYPAVWHGNSS